MRSLLNAFGQGSVLSLGDDQWLHLNGGLPTWTEALLRGVDPPGLRAGRAQYLREALKIERFAMRHFNFRATDGMGYRERNQVQAVDFDEHIDAMVLANCRDLGLVDPSRPRSNRYDSTLILGGGYRSPQLRTRYAAELAQEGTELGCVYLLGSPRPLMAEPPEAPAVAYYAPSASDEFDLLAAAALREFRGLTASSVELLCGCPTDAGPCPRWMMRHPSFDDPEMPWQFTHERRVALTDSGRRRWGSVLSASTGRPPYRPDTSDTLALWSGIARPAEGAELLIVTTQVFVPFQRFDAYRLFYLECGADIDVVGVDRGDRPRTTEYLLQETLSAIRSARRMMVAAAEVLLG